MQKRGICQLNFGTRGGTPVRGGACVRGRGTFRVLTGRIECALQTLNKNHAGWKGKNRLTKADF